MMKHSVGQLSYGERAALCTNPTSSRLFSLMEEKESNLCVAADVTTMDALLALARALGPYICVYKTHIDIVEDFNLKQLHELQEIADKHNFLLFEDRKFADIGKTVQYQYEGGIYRIASWAHIVNAHVVPGPGIIDGLREVGEPLGRGVLLLAEMSSKGTLAKGDYTAATVAMAEANPDFVIGFISQHKLVDDPRFVHMTPGVNIETGNGKLGQQYNNPEHAIIRNGTDVIIVGSGIVNSQEPAIMAALYRKTGWEAYKSRMLTRVL